ncbi:MAG: IS3 family transposase [Pseudomonadales bacterium]|nr:IS3 family transposase [Pseudomonadales bacterium]
MHSQAHSWKDLCGDRDVLDVRRLQPILASWRAGAAEREKAERRLRKRAQAIHPGSGSAYGSRRITAALRREGFAACRNQVRRVMRELGFRGRQYRSKNVTTRSGHRGHGIPDRVRRDFHPRKPDQLWAPDATWLPT